MFRKTTLIATACLLLHLATASAQYCPGNPDGTTSFNWTAESWNVWIRPNVTLTPVLTNLRSPFHPSTPLGQPNVQHLEATAGMGDYRPEDGWVLLAEAMGFSQSDNITFPQFVLYNRFESKMRYFVYLAGVTQANDVEVVASFAEDGAETHVSAALEHAYTPMDVVENYRDKKILITVPNSGFEIHGVWAMADIPIAYDPCTCRFPSALRIATKTNSYSNLNFTLDGGGDITQVIGAPSGGGSGSSVLNAGRRFANVTGSINTGISKGVSAYKTAGELAAVAEKLMLASANRRLNSNLLSTLNTISGISVNSVTGISSAQANFLSQATNLLPGQADAVHQLFPKKVPAELVPDWLKTAIPFASTAFALLDFIIGGGKSTPPQPMHFNADFSFKGEGTISQSQNQTSVVFYTPGSNYMEQISQARRPIYNQTMGILNVVEQPVMYRAQGPVVPSITTPDGATYSVRSGFSLKLTSQLKYALNPASGMQLNDIRAAMYFYNCAVQVNPQTLVPELMAGSGLIEEEPGVWRTPYMPVACLDAYTVSLPPLINFPNVQCDTDIQLHLVAKLTSPAGKETAWAARYRVNTTPAPYTYENTPPNPYLNVQENVEVPSIQDIINGNFQSWNPVVVTNDIVVTGGAVENYLNSINSVKDHDNVLIQQFVRGQVIKAPVKFDLTPNCGPNPPVDAAWLSNFCTTPNRYNPILALRTPSEEEEPVVAHKLNLSVAPNPTGDATLLKYNLLEAGSVSIVLSDYTGRRLAELHTASEQAAGEYQLLIPLDRYAPGIYVVTVARPSGKDSLRVVKH
jgi:hypothetical protein